MKRTLSIILILILAVSALCAQAAVEKQTLLSSENWASDSEVAKPSMNTCWP